MYQFPFEVKTKEDRIIASGIGIGAAANLWADESDAVITDANGVIVVAEDIKDILAWH